MIVTLLVLFSLVALFWAVLYVLPSQRKMGRFLFNHDFSPDSLNGLFRRDDVVERFAGDPETWPSVTVIVPGRNEGHVLAETLGSICAMEYPNYRVIFVDDQSTDDTKGVCDAMAVKYPQLTVIHNTTPPPAGWIGKTWAVHQAQSHIHNASADYLLFADSDLVFHPACLKQMMRLALHRRTDIASLLPAVRYETLGELLGMLPAIVLISIWRPLSVVNNPRSPKALVAGGFILAKRTSYEAIGGHEAVRGQMIEDIALGLLAKSKGLRVFTAGTHDLMTARMYEGWGDTYRGLKKNTYAGANYNPFMILPVFLFLLLGGALVLLYPLIGAFYWITMPSLLTLALLIAGVLAYTFLHAAARRAAVMLSIKKRTAWFVSFGFAFYLLIFVMSVIDYYRGGNMWAGRRISNDHLQTLADTESPPKP